MLYYFRKGGLHMPNKKPYQKKKKPITFPGFYPSWVYGPNEAITRANMKQYDREQAEYYAIIDERYGAAWYDLPYSERQQLKIEIRKEAKKRCQ